ncbi:hypothetical protein EAI_00891 [Harpegnathos saltator]|uniref:Ig-like domain-containing protein n=1 Tax=Harpegnathos saltator TaxID=610380 RepID=E2BP07_HARSA|nr:hypothetical protein EAI_00891 [Harpegnathos saltator]
MLVLQWIRGNAGVIRLPGRPKICQIVDPSGAIVAMSRGECYHYVKVVTVLHEGVWLARYNVQGMLEPVEERFRVETADKITLNAGVNYTENAGVRLLCRLESRSTISLQTCNFVRPDSRTIYITPVVANERYSAYISPVYGHASKVLECGITIRELASVDYGAWRCDLGVGFSPDMHGSVLRVDHPDSREHGNTDAEGRAVKTRADDVHVKRGDPFTIKCAVDFALDYCWLRSPNGTAYSVAQDEDVQYALHYKGDGLSYGECGAQISASVDSDDGQWSCFMGVVDGGEKNATVSVTVTDYSSQEDEGRWTCVAGLAGSNGRLEEAWAHIRVLPRAHKLKIVLWYTSVILGGAALMLIVTFAVSSSAIRNLPCGRKVPVLEAPRQRAPSSPLQTKFPVIQNWKQCVY